MYSIGVKGRFSAAHSLREYDGNCEKLHGHNWVVEVICTGDQVDDLGIVLDFRALKKTLGEVLETLDHTHLNDLAPFRDKNPSSENIASYIRDEVSSRLDAYKPVRLSSVKVWENEDSWVQCEF